MSFFGFTFSSCGIHSVNCVEQGVELTLVSGVADGFSVDLLALQGHEPGLYTIHITDYTYISPFLLFRTVYNNFITLAWYNVREM